MIMAPPLDSVMFIILPIILVLEGARTAFGWFFFFFSDDDDDETEVFWIGASLFTPLSSPGTCLLGSSRSVSSDESFLVVISGPLNSVRYPITADFGLEPIIFDTCGLGGKEAPVDWLRESKELERLVGENMSV